MEQIYLQNPITNEVQVVTPGAEHKYYADGWKRMSKADYEKWAEARWEKEKEVLYRQYSQQAAKAKEDDKPGLANKLMAKAAKYAPKKAAPKKD